MSRETVVLRDVLYCLSHFGFFVIPPNTRPGSSSWSIWASIDPEKFVGVVWRQNVGGAHLGRSFVRFGIPGLFDIAGFAFGSGKRVAIEVKNDIGALTKDQTEHLVLCRKTGVLAGVVRSYADCEKLLKEFGLVKRGDRCAGTSS